MVLPVMGPALVSAGASLLGGRSAERAQARAIGQQTALQREFAQHGIRWRVEDAKAAGLHPLFALGAQIPSYQPVLGTPQMGPAISEAGQNIGRALQAQQTSAERTASELSLKLLQSQIGETDARREYYLSEAARNAQSNLSATTFPYPFEVGPRGGAMIPEGQVPQALIGQQEVLPSQAISASTGDPSVTASSTPLWQRFRLSPDMEIVLPGGISGDAAEVLESLGESAAMLALTVQENRRRFGDELTDEFLFRYFGIEKPRRTTWFGRGGTFDPYRRDTLWRERWLNQPMK